MNRIIVCYPLTFQIHILLFYNHEIFITINDNIDILHYTILNLCIIAVQVKLV